MVASVRWCNVTSFILLVKKRKCPVAVNIVYNIIKDSCGILLQCILYYKF
jgi:hypothetical protein